MRHVSIFVRTALALTVPLVCSFACGGMSDVESSSDRAEQKAGDDAKPTSNKPTDDDVELDTPSVGLDAEEPSDGDGDELLDPTPATERDTDETEEPETAPEDPSADRAIDVEPIDEPAASASAEPPAEQPIEEETVEEAAETVETSNGIVPLEFVDDLSVLVIFDNSGSMDTYWDNGSRWDIANQALYDAFAPVATSLKVAGIRFPLGEECAVPEFADDRHFGWQLAGEFLEAWQASSIFPTGGTPMGQAFLAADAAIADARERGLLEQRFNVIVLTDGEPNCDTDPTLLTELPAQWLERGVKTHVLGLPGSDTAAQLLDQIAAAGGTEQFVHLGSAEQLEGEVLVRAR